MSQLAVAWCLKNDTVNCLLIGATSVEEFNEKMYALQVKWNWTLIFKLADVEWSDGEWRSSRWCRQQLLCAGREWPKRPRPALVSTDNFHKIRTQLKKTSTLNLSLADLAINRNNIYQYVTDLNFYGYNTTFFYVSVRPSHLSFKAQPIVSESSNWMAYLPGPLLPQVAPQLTVAMMEEIERLLANKPSRPAMVSTLAMRNQQTNNTGTVKIDMT